MLGRRNQENESAAAAPMTHKRLGEVLLEGGLITENQLAEAIKVQKSEGGFIGQILVQMNFISQDDMANCLVKQCKIPHLSLLDYDIGSDVLALVPTEVCQKYNLIPIDKLGRILTVAMVDPLDIQALEAVRDACPDLRIKPILCNWEHFQLVSGKLFGGGKSGGGGQQELTAQSLGLGAPAPKKPAPPPKTEAAAPPGQGAAPAGAPAAPAAPGLNAADLSSAVRDSIQQVMGPMQEAMQQLAQQSATVAKILTEQGSRSHGDAPGALSAQDIVLALRQVMSEQQAAAPAQPTPEEWVQVLRQGLQDALATNQAPAAPAPEDIAHMVRDGVGGAVQEALASVMVQMRAAAAAEKAAPDYRELAETIQGAITESMRGVAASMQPAAPAPADAGPAPAAGPDPDVLASAIRDSVGGALEETMAALLVQMRAESGRREVSGEALAEMSGSLRQLLEQNQQAQAEQTARMREIAEAALQSVRQSALSIESAKQQVQPTHSITSVTPFGEGGDAAEAKEEDVHVMESLEGDTPTQHLRFDTFLPGDANAFTHKISQAVAATPGTDYNPFFLYGNVGVGKTHLISAMGNAILENGGARVGYVSASHFARRLADAVRASAGEAFRQGYCQWDVLVLDDIQFLSGRVEAQEEFFHIFNVLHQEGRQIIIACDRAPDRLGLMEKRLVSRFSSGIVAELRAPEWETRMEILRRSPAAREQQVPEQVLSLIAMRVPNDIRKMTGALRKIVAYSTMVEQAISLEMADEILSHLNVEEAA